MCILSRGISSDTILRILQLHFQSVFGRIQMVTGHGGQMVLPGATLQVTGGVSLVGGAQGGGISDSWPVGGIFGQFLLLLLLGDFGSFLLYIFVCQGDANIPYTQLLAVQSIAVKTTLWFAWWPTLSKDKERVFQGSFHGHLHWKGITGLCSNKC